MTRPGCKKSAVWKYFKKNNDNKSASCQLCNKSIRSSGGTTNLKQHLLRIHPIQFSSNESLPTDEEEKESHENNSDLLSSESSALLSQPQPQSSIFERPSTSTTNNDEVFCSQSQVQTCLSEKPSTSAIATSERNKQQRPTKQLKLYGTRHKNELSEAEISEIDKKIVKMIAKDFQPISIVENEGFLEYTRLLQPLYKPPDRKKLANKILPKYYTDAASLLRTTLNGIKYLSVTSDIWNSDSNKAYVTITAHFIHEDKLYTRVLATREIPGSHTAENIAIVMKSILNEWNVFDKIMTVVSDNAANIRCAINDHLQKYHHPCVAHTLNLTVNEAIKNNSHLSVILKKCRGIVGFFKHSSLANDQLRSIQKQMGLPMLKVKQDVATRWNSCYIMLVRLLEIKDPLCVAVANNSKAPDFPDPHEWEIIADCVDMLKPANDLTVILSGEKYPTMSLIVPLIRCFQFSLNNLIPKTEVGETLKTNLNNIIIRRLGQVETNEIVAKATFLDPGFKKVGFSLQENANDAEKWVAEEARQIYSAKMEAATTSSAATQQESSAIGVQLNPIL